MGDLKVKDVLIAYPIVGFQIDEFIAITKEYPNTIFQCTVDSTDAAYFIDAKAKEYNLKILVFIDVDLGMGRTGVKINCVSDLYDELNDFSNIKVVGFHGYDGHIRDVDFEIRQRNIQEYFDELLPILKKLEQDNNRKFIYVFGGSNTFPFYAQIPFIECSPGTFVLWDWGYHLSLPEQKFQIASLVFAHVISKPGINKICINLGYKAIASENPLDQRFLFLEHENWVPLFQSEEHLVILVPDNEWENINISDPIYVIPFHICPTVAWYPYFQVIEKGVPISTFQIAPRY